MGGLKAPSLKKWIGSREVATALPEMGAKTYKIEAWTTEILKCLLSRERVERSRGLKTYTKK